jgi:ATP/maltotriose-dependent transcriptional regulator MalT
VRLSLLPFEEHYLEAALSNLTLREREVVLAICSGGTNDAVASRLCIALPTLRTHLMRLNQKLGTTSKGDVVRHAATILIDGYRRGELAPGRVA